MGRNTAEDSCFFSLLNQLLVADFRAVDVAGVVGKSSLACNMGNGHGIVTRDDFQINILRTQIVQCLSRSLTNRVGDFQNGQSSHIFRQLDAVFVYHLVAVSQHQNPRSAFLSLSNRCRIAVQQHFWCPQKDSSDTG